MQRNLETLDVRNGGRQANGEPGDLAADRQIPFEVGRGNRQNVSEVVEAAVSCLVSRQLRGHVDIEREEIADRVVVLHAIEAMDRSDSSRVRVGRPCAIDRGLERRGHRIVDGDIGPRHSGRRHRPGVKLRQDALPDLGVRSRVRDLDAFEHEARGMESLAMTGNAVLVENRLDVRWFVGADLRTGAPALGSRCLNGRQRSSYPAANGEREDRRTAFH